MTTFTTRALKNGLRFTGRDGTSDANSAIACAQQDEYGIRDFDLRDRVVFDIGSHIGGVAVLAASMGARVVAIEPVPENAVLVRENAALNGFDIVVLEAAAGAGTEMKIAYGWEGEGLYGEETASVHAFVGNSDYARIGYGHAQEVTVPTVSLAALVAEYGAPYLMKLDCEGGEWAILDDPLAHDVPVIVGEYHPWIGTPEDERHDDNRHEVEARIGSTHDLSYYGPGGIDAGNFRAVRR